MTFQSYFLFGDVVFLYVKDQFLFETISVDVIELNEFFQIRLQAFAYRFNSSAFEFFYFYNSVENILSCSTSCRVVPLLARNF